MDIGILLLRLITRLRCRLYTRWYCVGPWRRRCRGTRSGWTASPATSIANANQQSNRGGQCHRLTRPLSRNFRTA